jgi:hypothetical protein
MFLLILLNLIGLEIVSDMIYSFYYFNMFHFSYIPFKCISGTGIAQLV